MAIPTRLHHVARLSADWVHHTAAVHLFTLGGRVCQRLERLKAEPDLARRLARGGALVVLGLHAAWAGPAPVALASSSAPGTAGGSPAPSSTVSARLARQSIGCLIGPERVADIGTPLAGVVGAVKVDRGDSVKKGQVLVLLESEVEQAGLKAARARTAIDADVHAAQANLALARDRYDRLAGLVGDGFVATLQVEQARAERDVAEQKLIQARGQLKVQTQELGVAKAQLGQRTLRAPFSGVVAERFVNAGERVEDKPLLRVAMLDPLRVELVLPAARWGSVRSGERIGVQPDLPGAGNLLARVTHIDKMIDAASNTFRVRLALPNPGNKLPAGARCKVDLPAPADGRPGAPNPATPASPAIAPADLSSATPRVLPTVLRPTGPTPRLKLTI